MNITKVLRRQMTGGTRLRWTRLSQEFFTSRAKEGSVELHETLTNIFKYLDEIEKVSTNHLPLDLIRFDSLCQHLSNLQEQVYFFTWRRIYEFLFMNFFVNFLMNFFMNFFVNFLMNFFMNFFVNFFMNFLRTFFKYGWMDLILWNTNLISPPGGAILFVENQVAKFNFCSIPISLNFLLYHMQKIRISRGTEILNIKTTKELFNF